jgi:ATP-dependent Clp protease ATP-binding subunit ClpB
MNMSGEPEKPALEQYGVDLTARARDGKLDPVIGRDAEIHRTIQVSLNGSISSAQSMS